MTRFNDQTTIPEILAAIESVLQRLLDRDELTPGQECLGAACAFVQAYPESQTARDLWDWAHGSTPTGAVEAARAEDMEEWISEEDLAAFEAMP